MILSNEKRLISIFAAVVLCIVACYIAICVAPLFKLYPSPLILTMFVELICGAFLATSLGMLFSEHTRPLGVIYAVVFVATPYYYIHGETAADVTTLSMMYFWGIIIGGVLTLYYLRKNREDKVVRAGRAFLYLLWMSILAFLIYEVVQITKYDMREDYPIVFVSGVIVSALIYAALRFTTCIPHASEIMVLGPPASGKTYFALGLYTSIVKNGGRLRRTVTLFDVPCSLLGQYQMVTSGGYNENPIKRTERDRLVIHQLEMKKWKCIPVTWTIMDYAGEFCQSEKLNKVRFDAACENIAKLLDISDEEIQKRAGSVSLLKEINKNPKCKQFRDLPTFLEDVVVLMVYGRILRSGKVLFLIDGEKIRGDEVHDLTDALDVYNTIVTDVSEAKLKKLYAYCVTKTDQLVLQNESVLQELQAMYPDAENLGQVHSDSKESRRIEKAIAGILKLDVPFNTLNNNIEQLSTHFVAISIDPTAEKGEHPAGAEGVKLRPWGFAEILRFGK